MAPTGSRTAKPCNQWTANELAAYNITVVHQDFTTFFEMPTPPEPTINPSPHVLTTTDLDNAPDVDTRDILMFLDFAMDPGKSAVIDFAAVLLRALHYPQRGAGLALRTAVVISQRPDCNLPQPVAVGCT
jgi:hypothetical protein